MTRYTKNRRYPYPLRTNSGAGALDIERLARAFDRDAAATDTAWLTDLQRPSATWTATAASIGSGFDSTVTTGGAWSAKVGAFDATWQLIPAYWLVSVNMGITPNGTVTANSRRAIKVFVNQAQVGPFPLKRETYQAQDLQADTTMWLAVEFPTLIDQDTSLSYVVNHENTGSSVAVTLRSSVTLLAFA